MMVETVPISWWISQLVSLRGYFKKGNKFPKPPIYKTGGRWRWLNLEYLVILFKLYPITGKYTRGNESLRIWMMWEHVSEKHGLTLYYLLIF